MDAQTTALTALLTSLVYMSAPSPQPVELDAETRQAVEEITDSTKETLRLLKGNESVRPANADGPAKE